MNPIILAVIIVGAIGLLIGLILAFASIFFAVPKDEKAEKILQALPGANCGACGYSGCQGYAQALAKGEAEPGLCSPGGEGAVKAVAEILGVKAEAGIKKTAVVKCRGYSQCTEERMEYQGIKSCSAAVMLYGGTGKCSYGCIGFGDCKAACDFNAVSICDGVAVVNENNCKACGKCVSACPKNIIEIMPVSSAAVRCSNHDKGAAAKKACGNACIGCMRCVKSCEHNAVSVNNFLASIDSDKCIGCGACAEVCPQDCIII